MCVYAYLCPAQLLWTVAHQAPLSMGFPRRDYYYGLPFSTPGDLADPGVRHESPESPSLAGGFFTIAPAGAGRSQ